MNDHSTVDDEHIDALLEQVLRDAAARIDVPSGAVDRVLTAAGPARHAMSIRSQPARAYGRPLAVAASLAAVIALVVGVVASAPGSHTSSDKASSGGAAAPSVPADAQRLFPKTAEQQRGFQVGASPPTSSAPSHASGGAGGPSGGAADAAKIVRTASVQLEVEQRGALRQTSDRVRAIALGAGGYVSTSEVQAESSAPSGSITIRVPVGAYDTVVNQLTALKGTKLLGSAESGRDVTASYTDLQAQITALTGERDSLLVVLSKAQNIGDILAVHDRLVAVETSLDQVQGQANLLADQAAMSSIAISLAEKAPAAPAAPKPKHHAGGLAGAWSDARHGFAHATESIVAHSGGTIVVVLALLALVFLVRYLYPVLRRGLL